MIRLQWSTGRFGPAVHRDGMWVAFTAGVVLYLAWQVVVAAAAASMFFVRADLIACPDQTVCGLVDGWGDGLVGFVSILLVTLSIAVGSVLVRLLRGAIKRRFWIAWVGRFLGAATAVAGLVTILGWGLPWLLLGAWLFITAGRLRFEVDAVPQQPHVIEGETL